ncbi:hypothetical protein [Acanthopleuribacter pedis]|uniref:VCBS repeat-containing protein n=1 Tax=Acanthopleuribacter pedis TaxID=442870 RepID=A0A8J7QDP8_9BACT|nr:hypothetical protein [Acanthopleuribacter pedis]MBO1317720.1 hypothetical protein [Acanthopleuribacter pedis]
MTRAAVQLGSGREYTEQFEQRERLRFRDGQTEINADRLVQRGRRESQRSASFTGVGLTPDSLDLSNLATQQIAANPTSISVAGDSDETPKITDPKADLVKQLLEKIFKKKVDLPDVEDFLKEPGGAPGQGAPAAPGQGRGQGAQGQPGFGLEYDFYQRYSESERTDFAASGVIETADGRSINFDVALSMQRSYETETSISIRAGAQLTDPLVLNFNGNAAELSSGSFEFDLDSDGQAEEMRFLSGGSGFLAIDRNGDGAINDGSELFGTKSGNGFADLAAYDEDGNQFIDENDSVYSKLRIYNKDAEGNDQISTLAEKDVGAIYLGYEETPFTIKDENNETLAQVRSSGVFLKESGGVGTVQQVDLATRALNATENAAQAEAETSAEPDLSSLANLDVTA